MDNIKVKISTYDKAISIISDEGRISKANLSAKLCMYNGWSRKKNLEIIQDLVLAGKVNDKGGVVYA